MLQGERSLGRLGLASARGLGRVVAFGAAVALAAHFDVLLCPCAALFGVPCPGCGLTRAAWLLACGDLAGAVRLHPLSPLLLPVVVSSAGCAAGGWQLVGWARTRRTLGWLLLLLVIGVWLARFWGAFGGPVPVASLFERWRG